MNNTKLLFIAIGGIVLLVAGMFALGTNDSSENSTMDNSEPSVSVEDQSEVEEDGDFDRTIEMSMSNFEYSMEQIQAAPGEKLQIVINNDGGTHDFVIDELGVQSEVISSGESLSVVVNIPEDASGNYTYYCSIGNHRDLGMEGEIVVSQL